MDKQKIGLVGAILIVCLSIVSATFLTVKQIAVPPWLMTILGSVALILTALGALIAKSPIDPSKPDAAKADAPKDGS